MNKFLRDQFLSRREYYTFRKVYRLSRNEIINTIYEFGLDRDLNKNTFNYWVCAACRKLTYQVYGVEVE